MAEQKDKLDKRSVLLEDFIATCTTVFIENNGERHHCTAEQRGGAIWLVPETEVELEPGATVDLCCPHGNDVYRFAVDILEAEPDRIVATRFVQDPTGCRLSMRTDIAVPVTLTRRNAPGDAPLSGHTYNLSRSGMLVELPEPVEVGTRWDCTLTLADDKTVDVTADVVRIAEPVTNQPQLFGFHFLEVSVEVQRRLFAYILTEANPT